MSKARSMYAGSSGSNYGVNKNSPGNGNGKWQGLWPSVGHARNARHINIEAGGNNRNVVFCVNQLGGVGKISNMFATTADGVQDCKDGQAIKHGSGGRIVPSSGRGPGEPPGGGGGGGYSPGGSGGGKIVEDLLLLQDLASANTRKHYPPSGGKSYKLSLYQGAVPPDARKNKAAFIAYQKAMFEWAKEKNIDRVFFNLSGLDTYSAQTVNNLVEVLKDVPRNIQVGVVNEAQPVFPFETNDKVLNTVAGGLNPDARTWKAPSDSCTTLLKADIARGTKICIDASKGLCKNIDKANDYAKGDGSCKCNAIGKSCWTKETKDGCEGPLSSISGCPNQLQVSFAFIAKVNKELQKRNSPGGYITCVIADKENGSYAENILLYVACAHEILRPSLPAPFDSCMEVGLAGQGSLTPGGAVGSSLLYCQQNKFYGIEKMFLKGTGKKRSLRSPYNDIGITTYPELYWYMNDLKPLGCVGCDHTLTTELEAKSSADCLKQYNIPENSYIFKKYNKFFDHKTMDGGNDEDSLYSQCLQDGQDEKLCKCLGCTACAYSNPDGGRSVVSGKSPGSMPNKNIPYQRFGPYGDNHNPVAFASEIWNTEWNDPDPYKARIGTTRDLFTSNLYGMRAMFSNEISHNWPGNDQTEKIDGAKKSKYSCVTRRMGNDTCGTFDGFSNWSWDKFSQFLDSFSKQPRRTNLQEIAIYEWQFVGAPWLNGTKAEDILKNYH